MLRRILLLSIFVAAYALRGYAETPYDSVAAKASRFYAQKEWRSALAMYYMMLDQRPKACATYARAIAVAGIAGDAPAQKRLTEAAFAHRIGVDSLFNGIARESIMLGKADIFEKYLENVTSYEPWLKRVASAGLLKYFLFRHNGPEAVKYAQLMLSGMPDDIGYMCDMAQGYLDSNNLAAAEDVYRKVLAAKPDNVKALLYLGNAALAKGDKKAGAEYLRRAFELSPTPYLERTLKGLTAPSPR
ncbi:MAG: tetratricopeptide repeat protein [Paramuribaculum sp.]|nr:tetratricopeptide repeat protein [Paramuribaculum sp.]